MMRWSECSPIIVSVAQVMALDRRVWTLDWTETHNQSYGLKEAQVQACLDKPGPG